MNESNVECSMLKNEWIQRNRKATMNNNNNDNSNGDNRKVVIELRDVKRDFLVGDETVHALRGGVVQDLRG